MIGTDGEVFARFAVEKGKISRGRVNPKLFQPRRDGKLSVQHITGLKEADVKDAGERFREERGKSCLFGWARISRETMEQVNLTVCIDNKPHEGHTTVSGWPSEKNAILDTQKLLANASSPVLCC